MKTKLGNDYVLFYLMYHFLASLYQKSIVTLHSLRLACSRSLGRHTTEIILIFKKMMHCAPQ